LLDGPFNDPHRGELMVCIDWFGPMGGIDLNGVIQATFFVGTGGFPIQIAGKSRGPRGE
jgi:hypothetical protein